MLLAAMLGSFPLAAETYISAEPTPSRDIVGQANLSKMLNIGCSNLTSAVGASVFSMTATLWTM